MIQERHVEAASVRTRVAETGAGGAVPIILLPPGLYGTGTLGGLVCPTLRVWSPVVPFLAASRRVIAIDTPGQGGTASGQEAPSLAAALDHLVAVLDVLGIGRAHLVGHDEGALLAVRLAFRDPGRVASLTLVSALAVAPTGDGLDPVLLANPLEPRLSVQGQRWAFERVSHAPHHVTPDLVEEAVAIGASEEARRVRAAVAGSRLHATLARGKGDTFADLRETGLPVPAAVIWGLNDPIGSGPAHARALTDLIAARQTATQMHLINRAGYFPYREAPRLFAGLVAGFAAAVEG